MSFSLLRPLSLLIVFLISLQNAKSQSVSVADFGIKPDTYENITALVQKVINHVNENHKSTLIFPKGRYDFWPDGAMRAKYFVSNTSTEQEDSAKIKTIGMLFKNVKNLTVDGNGSLFIFHGKMTTIVLDHCENVILKNIHMDFERPTMSEMRYTNVKDKSIELEIHPNSKYDIVNNQLIWHGEGWKTTHFHDVEFDTTLKTMRYSDWKIFDKSKATEIRPNLVRFEIPGNFKPISGNIMTVRDIIRDQVGMLIFGK